ncbi:MAG: phosphotransferase [Acidimicrobiales bacterium]
MSDAPSVPRTPAREIAAQLECWTGTVDPQPLGGGITNTNFVVRDGEDTFVVRIGSDLPIHGIVRSHEAAVCRAAHACGLSPEIVHNEPGALVMRYIEAKTLTDADFREPETLERIVELLRRCHADMRLHLEGATLMFWVFQVCRNYLATASNGDCRVADRLADLSQMNEALERVVGPIQPAFCHNDLLPANLLDDGEKLWLLDWEYAGWNTPLFDLANLASNSQMDHSQELSLLETYFGRVHEGPELAQFQALKAASLLREMLWSLVQERHSSLEFNFEGYTDKHLDQFETAYRSLDLDG